MELFRQLDDRQMDRQTDGLTELLLKSLSRLKRESYRKLEGVREENI